MMKALAIAILLLVATSCEAQTDGFNHPNRVEIDAEFTTTGRLIFEMQRDEKLFDSRDPFPQVLSQGASDGTRERPLAFRFPRDRKVKPDTATLLGRPSRCDWSVDEYVGPRGDGFIIHCTITWNGQTWRRSMHYGRERERNRAGWYDPNENALNGEQ